MKKILILALVIVASACSKEESIKKSESKLSDWKVDKIDITICNSNISNLSVKISRDIEDGFKESITMDELSSEHGINTVSADDQYHISNVRTSYDNGSLVLSFGYLLINSNVATIQKEYKLSLTPLPPSSSVACSRYTN